MGHKIKPTVCEGCKVPKGWGEELIIENNEMYCGKLLIFKMGCKFSMHYHLIKDETWYVQEGKFRYRWIDTETAEPITTELLRYGYRVSILALPAPKNLCTKKALEVVGPKGFGYDFEYENLLKIPRK